MATTLLEECLLWLRHSGDDTFDDEIRDEIEACKRDLKTRGVEVVEETDPLVRKAAKLYVKAGFGFSTDQEKYLKMYQALADSMASSGMYKGGGGG